MLKLYCTFSNSLLYKQVPLFFHWKCICKKTCSTFPYTKEWQIKIIPTAVIHDSSIIPVLKYSVHFVLDNREQSSKFFPLLYSFECDKIHQTLWICYNNNFGRCILDHKWAIVIKCSKHEILSSSTGSYNFVHSPL